MGGVRDCALKIIIHKRISRRPGGGVGGVFWGRIGGVYGGDKRS
jgi:hypothetical protein